MAEYIEYNPKENTLSYGLWECMHCKHRSYAGGYMIHEGNCDYYCDKYTYIHMIKAGKIPDTIYIFGDNATFMEWRKYPEPELSQEKIDDAKKTPGKLVLIRPRKSAIVNKN